METMLAIAVGVVIPWMIQHAKKFGITSKNSIGLVAIGCAVLWVLFNASTPDNFKQNIYALFSQVMTTAFLIYEFIIKAKLHNSGDEETKYTASTPQENIPSSPEE